MSCGVGHRRGSDPSLLWLWCRPAAAAPIQPLAWEPPYVAGAAMKGKKRLGDWMLEVQQIVPVLKHGFYWEI